MFNLNSARLREETPHLSDALKRRAQSVINDKSIDAQTRAVIRYGLEINDPWLPELVRCVDNGESIIDNFFVPSSEEKIEALTDLICRRRRTLSRPAGPTINPRKLHPPQSPRKHRQAPRLHPLRRVERERHGRCADCGV